MYCSWEMPGPSLGDPPPSPALRRSWGKVLVCHKGLGGVFCVSGPDVCQPKDSGAGLPAGESLGAIGLSVIPGWTPQLYCCAKSLFSPPWYSLPPLFLSMGSLRPVSPPHSPSSILLPLTPSLFLSLHTSSSLFTSYPSISWLLPTFPSVVPSTDALSFSRD